MRAQGGGSPHATGRGKMAGRLRAWWRGLPLMRAFFCYAVIWFVASASISLVVMELLMHAFDAEVYAAGEHTAQVDSGPYVYDAGTGELVPAVSIEMGASHDHIAFLGMRSGTGRATEAGDGYSQETYDASTGQRVVYATMDLLLSDTSLQVMDWGGNYAEADYIAAGGNPYNPEPISPASLADYDAQERAERVPVDGEIARVDDGDEEFVISNVGYYVSQDSDPTMTGAAVAYRTLAVATPFVACGILAVVLFRKFYLRRLSGPLATLHEAADNIAAQNLDFSVGEVPGREFGRLAEAFEHMRVSLVHAHADLWRTAEDRRRLNAAFAHDLRTPVTVLKGTLEMASLRCDEGMSPDEIEALSAQVKRLEDYANSMSEVTKLEDRPVRLQPTDLSELASDLARQARDMAAASGREVTAEVVCSDGFRGNEPDAEFSVALDRQLVEEVAGNLVGNACAHADRSVVVEACLLPAERESGADASWTLRLVVMDDGPGFSPEALHHGCDPFFSEAKSAEHFGLGLNIARTLARLHGGDIQLANDPDGGARVTATFAAGASMA